jgi:hypothetical protein
MVELLAFIPKLGRGGAAFKRRAAVRFGKE